MSTGGNVGIPASNIKPSPISDSPGWSCNIASRHIAATHPPTAMHVSVSTNTDTTVGNLRPEAVPSMPTRNTITIALPGTYLPRWLT